VDTLEGMRTFIAVVSQGSFTAAADKLGISKALASKYLAQLEARLGVRLLNRSTRTLHTTEAGRAYYERCVRILEEVDALEGALREGRDEPRGTLTIAAPQTFGERFVSDAAAAFIGEYPQVEVELYFSDRYVNIVEEGIDLAIRIGELDDSRLVSRRLGEVHLIACASPGYLAARGTPRHPSDLVDHDCVRDRNFRRGTKWPFAKGEQRQDIDIRGRLIVNGIMACHRATLAGAGIGLLAAYMVEDELSRGTLVRVLDDYQSSALPISAVYPHRQYLAAKVKTFVDFIAGRIGAHGLDGCGPRVKQPRGAPGTRKPR
jgi:DNA-binding transcriptional LysR family regulator